MQQDIDTAVDWANRRSRMPVSELLEPFSSPHGRGMGRLWCSTCPCCRYSRFQVHCRRCSAGPGISHHPAQFLQDRIFCRVQSCGRQKWFWVGTWGQRCSLEPSGGLGCVCFSPGFLHQDFLWRGRTLRSPLHTDTCYWPARTPHPQSTVDNLPQGWTPRRRPRPRTATKSSSSCRPFFWRTQVENLCLPIRVCANDTAICFLK